MARSSERAHLNTMRNVPLVLERFGLPVEPVLRAVNLTRADLEDPERSAPFADIDRLVGLCARRTGCPHVGLLLAEGVDLQSFGITGRLARNAPTVGEALQDLATHFVLHDSGGAPVIAIHGDTATLSYGIHAEGVKNADHIYDFAAAVMLRIMRQLCGTRWQPDVALLPRARPRDIRPYREAFGVPVRFDSVQCAVVFPVRWLARSIAEADSLLHTLLEQRANEIRLLHDPMLHNDVRRTIRLLLPDGQCSRAAVARHLRMHPRTLGRRLQESGTTFQALLDQTRTLMAEQLLHDTRAPVARIAASLGYGDPTVFTRAFRRWTGRTPREFRAALQPGHRATG